VGSGSHTWQTGRMIIGLEKSILNARAKIN